MKNPVRPKVDINFAKMLKVRAAEEGISIIEYTRRLSKKAQQEGTKFDFKI